MRDNIYYITKSGEIIVDDDSSSNSIGHPSLPKFERKGNPLTQNHIIGHILEGN